ncbi:MAG: GNAT family N-acetyltransferase [Vitreoscilla sp.]|nr:GNAT family N-acetyltransferase [Vitreoscilla sp.]
MAVDLIRLCSLTEGTPHLPGLAGLLRDCVGRGASIGWSAVPSPDEAHAFWAHCLDSAVRGERGMWVAVDGAAVLGTVQLVLDMPGNGRHRAEIVKLQVAPTARRQGLAGLLMDAAETEALAQGRSLLVLDTRSGDSAEPLYRRRGYQLAGRIPAYALSTEGVLDSTSVMFKRFGPGGLQVRPEPRDSPDALALQEALSAELLARYGSDGKAGFAEPPAPGSVFAVARDAHGAAVGCGALRALAGEPGVGEIKRMHATRPGADIGRTLLAYLEHEAWLLGHRQLKLSTRLANVGAVAFYRACGYAECAPFGRYAGRPESTCLQKSLA